MNMKICAWGILVFAASTSFAGNACFAMNKKSSAKSSSNKTKHKVSYGNNTERVIKGVVENEQGDLDESLSPTGPITKEQARERHRQMNALTKAPQAERDRLAHNLRNPNQVSQQEEDVFFTQQIGQSDIEKLSLEEIIALMNDRLK